MAYRPLLSIALLASLAGSDVAAAQGATIVVDDDGGAGVQFTDIQPAIDAASPGDRILVRAGSYGDFAIDGKGVSVLGEGFDAVAAGLASPSTSVFAVRNVPAGDRASVAGMMLISANLPGLEVRDNAGVVALSGILLAKSAPGEAVNARTSMEVSNTELLLVHDLTLPRGSTQGGVATPAALSATGSNLWVMDSEIEAVHGGQANGCAGPGVQGGIGIALVDSSLYLADTVVEGGFGGLLVCPGNNQFGQGGHAIQGLGSSVLKLVSGELRPGAALCSGPGGGDGVFLDDSSFALVSSQVSVDLQPPACPGVAIRTAGGASSSTNGIAYPTLRVDTPVAAPGADIELLFGGEPGSAVSLFVGVGFGPALGFVGIDGATCLDPATAALLGVQPLDATGEATLPLSLPPSPLLLGVELTAQGLEITPSLDALFSSPTFLTIAEAAPPAPVPELPVAIEHSGPGFFGRAVALLGGDATGDGFGDYVVGAPLADDGGTDAGAVFLYSGLAPGHVLRLDGGPGDRFGDAVAAAGDLNGDGSPDFLIGAPDDDQGGNGAGAVFAVSGATGAFLHTALGSHGVDAFGYAVAGVGDVDGDGFPDFAGAGDGPVRVFSGASGLQLSSFGSVEPFPYLRTPIAGAGDSDGDGLADVLVGTSGDDTGAVNGGLVQAFSGSTGALLYSAFGSVAGGGLGTSVDGFVDLDADGAPEAIAGAPGESPGGAGSGAVRVLDGQDGTTLVSASGADSGTGAGQSVAGAGDFDGDGTAELLSGAPFDDLDPLAGPFVRTGSVSVHSGRTGQLLYRMFGETGSGLGTSVSGRGDVDGDGKADVLAGAHLHGFARIYLAP